jgi:hypothetical protein
MRETRGWTIEAVQRLGAGARFEIEGLEDAPPR